MFAGDNLRGRVVRSMRWWGLPSNYPVQNCWNFELCNSLVSRNFELSRPWVARKAPLMGEGGAFQSDDWRGTTFHASSLYPAIISRAAAMLLLQAHWKLYPPSQPVTSIASPTMYNPRTRLDIMDFDDTSSVAMPPNVTSAVRYPSDPLGRRDQFCNLSNSALSRASDQSARLPVKSISRAR